MNPQEKTVVIPFDSILFNSIIINLVFLKTFIENKNLSDIKMMRALILISFITILHPLKAQQSNTPFEAIEEFFEAFHKKEATLLKNAFSEGALMQRATYREGKSVLIQQDILNFISRVANRPTTPVWREELGTPVVQQSTNLATVWVPFRFYLDEKLSHCGVNQFTLFWNGEQWKIIHLIDTSEACETN